MIRVRPAHHADVPRWAELRAALWPDGSPAEHAAEARAFFDLNESGDATLEAVLVAEDPAEGVIGFAELSRRPYAEGCTTSPVGFLEGWYVAPAHRGRGVGRALVAAAEAWARSMGCREFASDTELDNTASAAAHRALGFEEVEIIRCFRKSLEADVSP
jgi:aminoglycoside 6'-N-acetyltransferase I